MLNIVFAGTPDFAANIFRDLLASDHTILAAFTQPDRAQGRGRKLSPTPVKAIALEHNIPCHQPTSLKDPETLKTLAELAPDVIVVVAYGLMVPENILLLPHLGCMNVHASLLPRWRGASPIQQAILHQDAQTGITIMQMDKGLDTGDMLVTREIDIQATDTLETLEASLATIGSDALLEALTHAEAGTLAPQKQNDAFATYAHKITKADALLHWHHHAAELASRVRALHPRPVTHTLLGDLLIKVHACEIVQETSDKAPGTIIRADKNGIDVATGNGVLRLLSLQLPGKKALAIADVLNGHADLFTQGMQFTS